ncbi:MAG: 3-deoxy-8-phosphooctulonate synthase [Planctomycetota bacterium]|nr:3-deoxy-8-phosphooctulonate synthase [Planctomycetota bacterium]
MQASTRNASGDNPRLCSIGGSEGRARVDIGAGRPLAIIAGPCVLESLELGLLVGQRVREACTRLGLAYVFKASFDKANRSSIHSPRGPGLEQGLAWLDRLGRELGVPVTTDIHEPEQAEPASRVIDLLQIPAFLCRQTDLLLAAGQAAAKHQRGVNVKKGQFMSPPELGLAASKLSEAGCDNVMFTERGTFFGYGRLVNDFIGLGDMIEGTGIKLGPPGGKAGSPPPVCFDCTHSTQMPGTGTTTGGRPERAPLLARAAVAAGVHAVFIECHPEPARALSDASTMQTLESMPALLESLARVRDALD